MNGHAAFLIALMLPAAGTPPPARYPPEAAPVSLARGTQAADAAIAALRDRLSAELLRELGAGGPLRAMAVCRDQAQALTAQIAREQGVEVGRTSHRLRNPRNQPRAWAREIVTAGAGRRAEAADAVVVDLGDRVGLLRPIRTGGLCTTCHGAAQSMPADLLARLRESYPEDRALDFAEGDLRGFFWAEAPK